MAFTVESGSLSLRFRLSAIVIVIVVVALAMGGSGYAALAYLSRTATEAGVQQLAATNRLIRDLAASSQDGTRTAVGGLADTLQARFQGRLILDGRHRVERAGLSTPRLSLAGRTLNFDYRDIDRFSRDSGGKAATIFARDGEDFVRIGTSLRREDGSRAVGTRLSHEHPAYYRLLAGESYRGHVRLSGRHFMAEYRPLADASGRVVGALFVGMDLTPSLDSLRRQLRQLVIGSSGYVVVIDAGEGPGRGELLVHPSLEGKGRRLGPQSPAAMAIAAGLRQRQGILFYDWADPAGESRPRRKVAALDEYPELHWIIASTADLDDFTRATLAGQEILIAATAAAALLLAIALNFGIDRLALLPMRRESDGRRRAEAAREESEARRRESEERYRLLLEHSPLGIAHYSNDLVVEDCNWRLAEMFRIPHHEMRGLDCRELNDPRLVAALRSALGGGLGYHEGLLRTLRPGLELNLAMSCAPLRDAAGNVVGGIAIVQDITERTLKDREIALYRDHLEEVVAERTAALVASRAEAGRLARAKGEFLTYMSHQIRTPLNGVLGMAQVGYRLSAGRSRSQEAFARILASGRLLLGIVNDILDYSKIGEGKLAVEAVAVDLHPVVRDSFELMRAAASARSIGFHLEIAADLPSSCRSDPVRLQQILLNLLAHAVESTAVGSVTLSAARDGEWLVFRVADTGIGMTRAEIERLDAPFEPGGFAAARGDCGRLGLAIVRRLVEMMGGEIHAESAAGEGSVFEARLPCVAAEAAPPSAAAGARAAHPLEGLSILVAEDDDVNQLVMEDNLRSDGARPVIVGGGGEAVERIRRDGPDAFDIVLMDIQMPDMDGFEAARRILEIAPGLPIVGQTAHALAEERDKCFAAGMVDHIAKPIDPDELVTMILRHVSGGRTRSCSRTA